MTTPAEDDKWSPPTLKTPTSNTLFVDASKGSDTNAGTLAAPFATIAKAVNAAKAGTTVLLRVMHNHMDGLR